MLQIIDDINKCAIKHMEDTGQSPNKIYLGRTEMTDLENWCLSMAVSMRRIAPTEGATRPTVAGMKVYQVNAEKHMACST